MELRIGEKIAKYRKLKGYTQEQLGELVGVSGQAVSKWENGGVPDTYLLPAISKILGVSIDALFEVEKKISDYSQDDILDDLFKFCLQKPYCKEDKMDFFKFMFETIWTLQSASRECFRFLRIGTSKPFHSCSTALRVPAWCRLRGGSR